MISDVSVVFFLVSAMTIALYLIAYMLMYAAAIRLRYSAPALPRPFTVPGGMAGMWLTAGIGFAGVLFSFVVSFFPPDQLPVGSPWIYTGLAEHGIGFKTLAEAVFLRDHVLAQLDKATGSRSIEHQIRREA